MKLPASLLLLSALGTGGGAAPPDAQTSAAPPAQAGASFPPPPERPEQREPQPLPAMDAVAAKAGDERPRATSSDRTTRYDEVGLASWYGEELGPEARTASGAAFDPARPIAAHRTLPLGSFVEVTALDTGRTIIVEVADRGPHRDDRLIDLSRGAAQQLGTHAGAVAAVRVRQVTPTAQDVAALRAGTAATRLDAPDILLTALRKRLPGGAGSGPSKAPAAAPAASLASPAPTAPAPARAATSAPTPVAGRYRVQVATLSTRARADGLARSIGGTVLPAGSLFRVQLGPFASRSQAQAARDRVAARGYGDAQVLAD